MAPGRGVLGARARVPRARCWLPLHDVSEEMGTMQFVPGSHRRGVLPHHPKDGDVSAPPADRATSTRRPPSPARSRPADARSTTPRTLHFTAPNVTDRPRLACPTEFEVMPARRDVPAVRPWVDEWRAVSGHGAPSVHPRRRTSLRSTSDSAAAAIRAGVRPDAASSRARSSRGASTMSCGGLVADDRRNSSPATRPIS